MKTLQRLPDENALRTYSVETQRTVPLSYVVANHDWTVVSTDPIGTASLNVTGNDFYWASHYVIEMSTGRVAPVVMTLNVNNVFETADRGGVFVFSCVAYSENESITINAALYDANGVVNAGNTRTIQGGTWGAVRSNQITIANNAPAGTNYKVVLTISNHNAGNVRISTPNLVNDIAWANSPVVQSMRPFIPDFYQSYDSREEDPTYPFFRFVEVLTDAISDTMNLYSEWFRYDRREIPSNIALNTYESRSRLVDYEHVRSENSEWLMQFSGNKIKNQIYINNTGIIDNNNLAEFKTWQLYPAGYGRGAGTQSAIREAAKFVLTGTKSVIISQRHDNNPWAIRVTTVGSQTPGLDIRTNVRAASTGNINISSGLVNGTMIDSNVTLVTGDRVLLKNQSTASQNGVYIVAASGAASRATDFDAVSASEVANGALFFVSAGLANKGKAFVLTTTGTITIGTTGLTFSEFADSPEVLAAVEPARPLGYSVTHRVVEKFTLTLGDAIYGELGTAVL
jgi:hypothetical protein